MIVPAIGEIWWTDLGDIALFEGSKHRPTVCLALATDQEAVTAAEPLLIHEDLNSDGLMIPIAGHNDWERDVFGIPLPRSSANGLRKDSFALWFYPMMLGSERFQERIGSVERRHLDRVFNALQDASQSSQPPRT